MVSVPLDVTDESMGGALRSSGPGSEDVQRILERMGHTHQRMARPFGDLSAVVEDPA